MKKAIFAVFAMLFMAFSAHAANPLLVKGTAPTGQQVTFGMEQPYIIYKDTGAMHAVVRSALSEQRLVDNAGWTKYNELVAACGAKCVAVPGSANGKVINVQISNTTCSTTGGVSSSLVAFPNWTENLNGDGCAFHAVVN